jgi:aflatoxin B1 aldehyde reductase
MSSNNNSTMNMKMPRLYLGSMTFGWSQTSSKVDESIAATMLQRFLAHNAQYGGGAPHRLDTARIYAGGQTEEIVGAVLAKHHQASSSDNTVLVGTKAHPSRAGGLSAVGVTGQWKESMEAMQMTAVEEYYLHQPDTEHSLEDSLRHVNSLVKEGLVKVVGLSNYHAMEVERAFALCATHGWTPPKVYQGLYNPLNRAVEEELLPLLRKHKCSFVAYNPLAAGLLTGKHMAPAATETPTDGVLVGRFRDNPNYLPRFYTPANFAALQLIRTACEAAQICLVEATYRWMLCHSGLGAEDGLLLGASSLSQLDENLAACVAAHEKDALPEAVLQAFDDGWKLTQAAGVFPYWRSYSSDMPDRESLDPGASYNAAKKKP